MLGHLPSLRRVATRLSGFVFRSRHSIGLAALLACASISISCERAEKPSDAPERRELVQPADPNEVLIASLEQVDGVWRQQGVTEPFTGRAVERFKGGRIAVQSDYAQGVLQLKVQWLKSGTKKSETKFRDGEAYFQTKWRSDGSKKFEEELKDGITHGSHKRWHANGQLAWIGEFYDGKWHGLVEDRDPDGNLIIKGKYDMGTLVEDLLPEK